MSKQAGRMSQSANDFLEPKPVTNLVATDVGTNRPFNNGAASVSWTLPADSPAAVSYDITTTPTTVTTNTGSTSATITGLSSNTSYTVTVIAKNAAGNSAGTTSSSFTATTVPQAPSVSATDVGTNRPFNNGAATVTVTANATGGKAISTYAATPNGLSEVTGASSTLTPTGMASATGYTFTGRVANANGYSAASSATASVTITTVPAAPGGLSASNNGQNNNRASWSAPSNGGKAISSYNVFDNGGNAPDSINTGGTTADFTGQADNFGWFFNVEAINANGTSARSSNSNTITTTPFSFAPFGFAPFGFTPFGFSPFGFTPAPPFGFSPFGFTPAPPSFGFTPAPPSFGFTPAPPSFNKGYKSVSANTLIKSKNPEGLTPAISLTVGDVLYSADIADLDSGSTLNSFQYGWSSSNISVNTDKETTVMGLTAYFVDEVYVINGSKFSDTHFILIKREENGLDVIKFERVTDILSTDMLWSQAELNWVPINSLQVLAQRELVVCINVEPYDVFFIEGDILVHDSQPLEHIKQYAVSAPGEDLTEALMALYDSVVNEERYIQEATDAVALLEQTQSPNDLQSAWTAVLLLNSDPFELVENEDSIKAGLIARIRAVEDNIIK
jgi:hypothetical protein